MRAYIFLTFFFCLYAHLTFSSEHMKRVLIYELNHLLIEKYFIFKMRVYSGTQCTYEKVCDDDDDHDEMILGV